MGGGGGEVQETSDQLQEQKNNVELWNYYQTSYKPFINKYIANTTQNVNSDAKTKAAAGQVNAEVMKAASMVKPGSGNAMSTSKKLDSAASIESAAQNEAAAKVRQQGLQQMQNIVDIGRGQTTDANAMQGNIAEQSLQSAIKDKQAQVGKQASIENAVGSGVGVVAGAVQNYMGGGGAETNPLSGLNMPAMNSDPSNGAFLNTNTRAMADTPLSLDYSYNPGLLGNYGGG